MLPVDENQSIVYQQKMYERKKANKKAFWNYTLKKKIFFKVYQLKIFNSIFEKFCPYEIVDIKQEVNYFSTNRIAIYTSVFGDYDEILEPLCIPDNCDFFIFSDKEVKEGSVWKKRDFDLYKAELEKLSNIEKNRFFKMFPNKVFPDYEYSIYLDGNIEIHTDLTEFIHNMNPYGLKMHNHYRRSCVYKEIDTCIKFKKDSIENLLKQKEYLLNHGMPPEYGLLEAPMIVRQHHNSHCIKLMNEWWTEFNKFSRRDQISLPFVLWKNGIKVSDISLLGNDIASNYSFSQKKHLK